MNKLTSLMLAGDLALMGAVATPVYSACTLPTDPLINMVNAQRKAAKLPRVTQLCHLVDDADRRAEYLVVNNQWSHDGYQQAIRGGLINKSGHIGEDLARDFNTDQEVLTAWNNSPSHYRILMAPDFKYIAVGRYQNYVVLWMTERW